MKKLALTFALMSVAAFAETWTGTISDANCGAKHADASQKSIDCVQRCVGRLLASNSAVLCAHRFQVFANVHQRRPHSVLVILGQIPCVDFVQCNKRAEQRCRIDVAG